MMLVVVMFVRCDEDRATVVEERRRRRRDAAGFDQRPAALAVLVAVAVLHDAHVQCLLFV